MFNKKFWLQAAATFGAVFIGSLIFDLSELVDAYSQGGFTLTLVKSTIAGTLGVALRAIQPFFSPFLTIAGETPKRELTEWEKFVKETREEAKNEGR